MVVQCSESSSVQCSAGGWVGGWVWRAGLGRLAGLAGLGWGAASAGWWEEGQVSGADCLLLAF